MTNEDREFLNEQVERLEGVIEACESVRAGRRTS